MVNVRKLKLMTRPGMVVSVRRVNGGGFNRDDRFVNGYFSSMEWINETNAPLYIQDRLGSTQLVKRSRFDNTAYPEHHIDPDRSVFKGAMTLRYTFSFESGEENIMHDKFAAIGEYSDLYKQLANKCLVSPYGRRIDHQPVIMEIIIRIDHSILNDDKALNFPEIGITVANPRSVEYIKNPQSLAELIKLRRDNLDEVTLTQGDPAFYRFKAYVNTKDKVIDKLYIRVFDDVQEIPVLYDPTREHNSFEVFSKRYIDEDGISHPSRTRVYKLKDAFDKYALATSVQEAHSLSEKKLAGIKLEKEITEEKNKLRTLQLSYTKMENDHRAAELKHAREMEALETKYKHDLEKENRERIKDEERHRRDMAMNNVKTMGELQKSTFSFITNITTFLMFIVKTTKA